MAKIVFIEGISGAGKSTLLRASAEKLCGAGRAVRAFVEFDYANPIDFYCTAYLSRKGYADLLARYPREGDVLARNAHRAGEAVLVRYYDKDTPLFPEPLLGELAEKEFCYHPRHLVSFDAYSAAYRAIWESFTAKMKDAVYLFDGSLLHHPLNDMLRNYDVAPGRAAAHIHTLLEMLQCEWHVFYLRVDDIAGQLARAHRDRGQEPPSPPEIAFWTRRREFDRYVLNEAVRVWEEWDIARGWDGSVERVASLV